MYPTAVDCLPSQQDELSQDEASLPATAFASHLKQTQIGGKVAAVLLEIGEPDQVEGV
jgi:hypothetical protein